jgi:hypothetical protein
LPPLAFEVERLCERRDRRAVLLLLVERAAEVVVVEARRGLRRVNDADGVEHREE